MFAKWIVAAAVTLVMVDGSPAQQVPGTFGAGDYPPQGGASSAAITPPAWRTPGAKDANVPGNEPIRPLTTLSRTPIARVTKGSGTLPNDAGQEWRDYDISPYTLRVTSTNRPEQAIVDWILLDTGYETWHSEPLGLLSASRRTLHVYHTPQIQAVVGDMVDRFVNSEAESHAFGLQVLTVGSPNWRTKAHRMLHAVPRNPRVCKPGWWPRKTRP